MGNIKHETEIHKAWNNWDYQKMHAYARKEIEQYLKELNYLYDEKRGEGFIRYIESRMKTPESIIQKMERKGMELSVKNMKERINDISGVRIVCYDVKQIYWITNRIAKDGRYKIIKFKDYIRKPKKNGYESFHMLLSVPVRLTPDGEIRDVKVELQLRTILMDAWAAMDARIRYKKKSKISDVLEQNMQKFAKTVHRLDKVIQEMLAELDE